MLQYFDTLTDDSGNSLLGATVAVGTYPANAPAAIYQTNGTTQPIANSTVSADITGQVSFYAPDGAYILTYTYKGTQYKVRSPVQLLDPISFTAIADAGAVNAYVVTDARLPAQLYTGLKVEIKISNTNTGASTLVLNGSVATSVVQPGGAALAAGMLQATGLVRLEYDGAKWQLIGSQPQPFYGISLSENALGIPPVNTSYPEGYLLRYLAAFVSGVTDCTAALNNATKVCAYGKAALILPPGVILISATWDCTSNGGTTSTNGGLTVLGAGKVMTLIKYVAGANNIGIAWDQTGLAYGHFESFGFIGGASTANCPKVTLLQGATNNAGFIFSGNNLWIDVDLEGYGDNVWYCAGCEAQDFIDCTLIGWRDNSFGAAQPVVFVASGSTPLQTSAIVTTWQASPGINSMTLIHWYGAKAAMIFHGSFGVVFHFTAATAGACADIRFDDWFQVITPAGAFKFMTDDSAGFAGTGLFNCGAERSVMEVATSNQNLQMCDFSVALPKGIKFEGHAGAGHAISARPFQFEITAVPTNCTFEWDPNESSTWTGDYIVQCAGTENGLRVVAPVAFGNLMNATSSRTIDSFPGFGFQGQGTDYGQLTGMLASVGPSANGQFNRVRKLRAGAFVSANSDWNDGVQTTQNVANVATNILALPNYANLVIVTGANGGGDKFCDLVFCTFVGATVLSSLTASGAPAARTYTFAANQLKLAMGTATTLNIQASCLGFGMQA